MTEIAPLAARLRSYKDRSGMSFDTLAKRTGVSKSSLHRYCAGIKVPHKYAPIHAIAEACGASSAELQELHRLWALGNFTDALTADSSETVCVDSITHMQNVRASCFSFYLRARAQFHTLRLWRICVPVLIISLCAVSYFAFSATKFQHQGSNNGITYYKNAQPVSVQIYNVERGCRDRQDRIPACSMGLARDPQRKYDADNVVAHRVWHNDTLITDCVVYDGDRVADETGVGTTRWFRIALSDVPGGHAWLPAIRTHDNPALPRCK